MSVWVPIGSVEQLQPYLVADQVTALNTSALGSGQSDRFDEVVATIVTRVRNKIASCRSNVLSATPNSVPPEAVWIACWLIIEAIQPGIPGLAFTEDQVRLLKKAEKDLDAMAACELAVSAPEDPLEPSGVQGSGGVAIVSNVKRKVTRETLSGL